MEVARSLRIKIAEALKPLASVIVGYLKGQVAEVSAWLKQRSLDLEAAKIKREKISRGGYDSHLDAFREIRLNRGEKVISCLDGKFGGPHNIGLGPHFRGCMIITNQRGVCYRKTTDADQYEAFSFESITSIEGVSKGMTHTLKINLNTRVIIFSTKTESAVFDKVRRDLGAGRSSAKSHTTEARDPQSRIPTLQVLRDAGVITEAEFQEKRAAILALA